MSEYILAIDGGGTSCRAAIATLQGVVLGRGQAGPANVMTDAEGAVANICKSASIACEDAGLPLEIVSELNAFLGLAGNNVSSAIEKVERLLPFKHFRIESDGVIALQGALGNDDGIVAILGTGSVYLARHNNIVSSRGGWGFKLADLGSGARLGQALLQESLLVFDQIHRSSPLVDAVLGEFAQDPARIVSFAQSATPSDYGRFAPRVFEAAAEGDAIARRLVCEAAGFIDEALDAMMMGNACPICLLGGLSSLYPAWIAERHRRWLVDAKSDALSGAIALAIKHFGNDRGGMAA